MNIPPVEDELFHADGLTDMKKLTVAFRKISKISQQLVCWCKRKRSAGNEGSSPMPTHYHNIFMLAKKQNERHYIHAFSAGSTVLRFRLFVIRRFIAAETRVRSLTSLRAMKKIAVEQNFLPIHWVSPNTIITPLLHTHFYLHCSS